MPVIEYIHTNSTHNTFQQLSSDLEKELFLRDGDLGEINFELNKIDFLPSVVLLLIENLAVGCGAFRKHDAESVEIKRMYVVPEYRRNNFASGILTELETVARKAGYKYSLLETGKNQPEAISFYLKHGYTQTENFGRYRKSANSVCFRKAL